MLEEPRESKEASSTRPTSSHAFPPSPSPPRSQPSSPPRDPVSACQFHTGTRARPGFPCSAELLCSPSPSGEKPHSSGVIREGLQSPLPSLSPPHTTPLFLFPRRQTHESSFSFFPASGPLPVPSGTFYAGFWMASFSFSIISSKRGVCVHPAPIPMSILRGVSALDFLCGSVRPSLHGVDTGEPRQAQQIGATQVFLFVSPKKNLSGVLAMAGE